MSAADDLNSTTKGQAQNLGTLANWAASPGQSVSGITSPKATVVTTLSTASLQVIAASTTRRALEFYNSNPSGQNIWVVPAPASAVINNGVLIVPGGSKPWPPSLACNAAFNAIAATGSTNVLTVIEFF
jgi:hypothetical protein